MDNDKLRELRAKIEEGLQSGLGPTLDEIRVEEIVRRVIERLRRERASRTISDTEK